MKIASVLLAAVVAATAVLFSATVEAGKAYPNQWENSLIKVCEAVRDGKKLRLNRLLKRYHLSHKAIQDGLQCNGYDPVTFAAMHGQDEMASFVAKRSRLGVDIDSILAKN